MSRTIEQVDADLAACTLNRQSARTSLAQRGGLTVAERDGLRDRVELMDDRIDRLLEERFLAALERLVAP